MGVYVCEPCATQHNLTTRPHTQHQALCEICIEVDGNLHATKTCNFTEDLTRRLCREEAPVLAQLAAKDRK